MDNNTPVHTHSHTVYVLEIISMNDMFIAITLTQQYVEIRVEMSETYSIYPSCAIII